MKFTNLPAAPLILASIALAQEPSASFLTKLDASMPALLEKHREPGIAVAFVDRCQASVRVYGVANREHATPVRADTVFNLGSISKMFTAWSVMTLVEEGRVKLDEPVETYLKRWHLPDSAFERRGVTVRRLLNHTAGISVHGVAGTDRDRAIPSLINELNGAGPSKSRIQIVKDPGAGFQYSGGGYAILQLLVEDITGRPLAEYARAKVFRPLGMKSTSFNWTDELAARAATPYRKDGSATTLRQFSAAGAAGLLSTAQDMSEFLLAHCAAGDAPPGRGVLKPQTLEQMRKDGVAMQAGTKDRYALGYLMVPGPTPQYDLAGHSGSNIGWKAEVLMMPSAALGIAVLTNSDLGELRSEVKEIFGAEVRSRVGR
jgi:CubicO group peptidase (beta-lactamase class C family)